MPTIDPENAMEGNMALASVLLLYYNIVQEGRLGLNESVCVDPGNFDPFTMIDVQVHESLISEIDQEWIREGAAVMIAGGLLGIVGDSWGGREFLTDGFVQRCIEALARCPFEEMQRLADLLEAYPGNKLATHGEWEPIRLQENLIYKNFVVRRLRGLLPQKRLFGFVSLSSRSFQGF